MRPRSRLALVAVPILLGGCVSPKPTSFAQVEFAQAVVQGQNFYVERHPGDERNVAEVIGIEIAAYGVKASSGAPRERPPETDIIVRYSDRFGWSFGTFLASLAVMLYDVENEDLLAAGRAESVVKLPPEEIIHAAVASIFQKLGREPAAPRP